ncbi:MAG: nucleotidyltransferase family protein [Gammaproteobacteria bacterium]|jgi:hypothetical protein|nr:nucleotidyltransferase family protein [Gammaproteobacteria bacterium]MBU0772522.1 nucleotidyltransferase family protein [Gammaproteobacteria bacterium]MBU0855067.1 nucleotidyltransferase family protein [Gammaproteobacteria bacterium]MBU1847256.1 nucleotidyltransferase family protein [Gammaproteobacteria bacterium]
MSRHTDTHLARTLANPSFSDSFTAHDWEALIGQARTSDMLGQVAEVLGASDRLERVPAAVRFHLDAALRMAALHKSSLLNELAVIGEALQDIGQPVLLLKGAAYAAADLPAGRSRVFNDIDLMVAKDVLNAAESALYRRGWLPTHLNAYDQRYYREWMHELPPIEHRSRGTVIDLHHTIVPPTSGHHPDAAQLIADARPVRIDGCPDVFHVLSPVDMVMHSACHLFFGELQKGLRDLYDLHALLSELSADPAFQEALLPRARTQQLEYPVLLAVHFAHRVFGTRIPESLRNECERRLSSRWNGALSDHLIDAAMYPQHPSSDSVWRRVRRQMLYARSHWLRMPLHQLLPHLAYKALVHRDDPAG